MITCPVFFSSLLHTIAQSILLLCSNFIFGYLLLNEPNVHHWLASNRWRRTYPVDSTFIKAPKRRLIANIYDHSSLAVYQQKQSFNEIQLWQRWRSNTRIKSFIMIKSAFSSSKRIFFNILLLYCVFLIPILLYLNYHFTVYCFYFMDYS